MPGKRLKNGGMHLSSLFSLRRLQSLVMMAVALITRALFVYCDFGRSSLIIGALDGPQDLALTAC
jgi:hypothetical protein